jgi:ABC-type Fe3+ transport system substrate-binding protein
MEMREKGGPVLGQVFKDAGILSYWYLAVPANARNPNAATLLAGFLVSKEGQEIVYKVDKGSSHLVEGTQMNKYVKEQEQRGVKFHSTAVNEVVKQQEEHSRLRQKFQNILQGK